MTSRSRLTATCLAVATALGVTLLSGTAQAMANPNPAIGPAPAAPARCAASAGGLIGDKWRALGAENGALGCPTSGEQSVKGRNGKVQTFEHGQVVWSPGQGDRAVFALYTRGNQTTLDWGSTLPYTYNFFIVRWDLNGRNVGQRDIRGGPSDRGTFSTIHQTPGIYTFIVEGCDNGSRCLQSWSPPLSVPVGGAPPPAPMPKLHPYACQQGFVWRDAEPADVVCVSPQARDQARNENALAVSRRSPSDGRWGPDTCKQGFKWRETRPSDHVCAPPASWDQAQRDNANGIQHLVDPAHLPGGGVAISTQRFQTYGGRLLANGRGLSPRGAVDVFAAGVNKGGLRALGTVTADGNGVLPRDSYVNDINPAAGAGRCELPRGQRATIVVLDRRSGIATTAGTTDAFSC